MVPVPGDRVPARVADSPLSLPRFSVVVPTRGDPRRLQPLFHAFGHQTLRRDEFEVILVFDGAPARDVMGARVDRVAALPERRGPGAARNAGVRAARAEWIAFTEDDCAPAPDWLERAAARIASDPCLELLEGETVLPGGRPARRRDGERPNFLPTNLFVARSAFDRVGGYAEDFFDAASGIYFREDSDFGFRLEEAGVAAAFAADVRVVHPREHARFLDPLRWARRYEMDPLLEWRHPDRFRDRIEVARLGPFRIRRVILRASFGYLVALATASAAFLIGERGLAVSLLLIAALLLLPLAAKWRLHPARLPLLPIVPFVLAGSYVRGRSRVGRASGSCALCGSRDLRQMALLQSDVDGRSYRAVRCNGCGVLFADPTPELTVESLQRIYGREYTEDAVGPCAADRALEVHRAAIARQMDLVERYVPKGRALNVGAMGGAIKILEDRGWTLRLVEVSSVAAETAREKWGLDVTISRLEDFDAPEGSFDFVRLGHVIEHLADPKLALQRISRILRPGGVLQIETDNARGLRTQIEFLIRRVLGERLSGGLARALTRKNPKKRYGRLIPPVHVYSFTPGSLTRLLESTGFEVIVLLQPAWGDPTWFPITDPARFGPVERAFIHLDQLGGRLGLGDVIALLARRKEPLSS